MHCWLVSSLVIEKPDQTEMFWAGIWNRQVKKEFQGRKWIINLNSIYSETERN